MSATPLADSPEQAARDLGRDVVAVCVSAPLPPGIQVLVAAWHTHLAQNGARA